VGVIVNRLWGRRRLVAEFSSVKVCLCRSFNLAGVRPRDY